MARWLTALVMAATLVTGTPPARAQDARAQDVGDKAAIRTVIERQIAAFQRDDGETAFSFASPMIRQMFGRADIFMDMVRSGYAPVYHPRAVDFQELKAVDGSLVQQVRVVGPDGVPATALYTMERQPDGSWRIAGCELVKEPEA